MRKPFGASCGIAAVLVVFACSSSSSRPPTENGCKGTGCIGGGSGGGGGSSGGASSSGSIADSGEGDITTICGVPSNASQCSLCLANQCCTQLTGCRTDMNCYNIDLCVIRCGGGSTCINTCEASFAAGTSLYEALSSCAQGCAICLESGTGDPCGGLGSYPCTVNLTCNGLFCSRTCVTDSDCTGIGPEGGNYIGNPNACIKTTGGLQACAPGCTSPGDCAAFAGTICRTATDASDTTVSVCGSVSDAATE
jgi:hypothetical protein